MGQGIAGETVSFTLDGSFAGQAVTGQQRRRHALRSCDRRRGRHRQRRPVVASFAGDINYMPSNATGDLIVSAA